MSRSSAKISWLFFLVLFFSVLFCPTDLIWAAASAPVNARVFIAGSAVPDQPTNLVATVLSSSAIDLAWQGGATAESYAVYRDGSLVATVFSASYSDSGLTPATSYSYYVIAYDSSSRASTPSATVNATTLVASAPAVTVGTRLLVVSDLRIVPATTTGMRTILVSFKTNVPALSSVRYGLNEEFSLGTIQKTNFLRTHSFALDRLPPGDEYFISITLRTEKGDLYTLKTETVDGSIFGDLAPADVTNFVVRPTDRQAAISWRNPRDRVFSHVYLVRSDKFYPYDLTYGAPLYVGDRESFVDIKLSVGQKYYYAIFACNISGLCSPGAYSSIVVGRDPSVSTSEKSAPVVEQGEDLRQFSGSNFVIKTKAKNSDISRLYLSRIYKGDQLIGTYQMTSNAEGGMETSNLTIDQPGSYRYVIEFYRLGDETPERLSVGQITIVDRLVSARNRGLWSWWWLLLLIFYLLWKYWLKEKRGGYAK
ncbi:MAG: hypothetical protein NTY66_01440 [Candidatus Vogelbacteria bacterium]|nr:hypothetical protein [Candidatus Vogelbacteria bacterium]